MVRPRSGRRRGRPPLQCNVWLEQAIADLPDARYFWILFDEWFDRYRAEVGHYARDPRASFRQAAFGCLGRMGVNDGLNPDA